MKLSKKTSVLKILQEYPEVNQIFKAYGLGCAKCLAANYEDLETVAKANNLDLNLLLKELNNLIQNN
ncbi:hybrid cluster-associated redox disulfide protein [Orenia metallireducens]|uniref:Hybrid cluster protein-associated redox disulfide domain-containing protein n=1 Tax=Orenia metallireducens TaxID=1413210 RepID=A0A285GEU1_9FIRM|nr:DUF1858 domain-containing protein [Orenia metallireducens]PRX30368.1 hybrid cluster-associated redox disulfide protein [Orenia metallireducens]SNY22092.1 hybrid cluster protein-associated redox disulfide domain-containing protein [Orenia metallireducens]